MKNLWLRVAIALLAMSALIGPFANYAPKGVAIVCSTRGAFWCNVSVMNVFALLLFVGIAIYKWALKGRV